jgi:ABC-type antimicrobial peptide transport system permease subunit
VRRSQLQEPPVLHYYVPFGQERGFGGTTLLTRTRAGGQAAEREVARAIEVAARAVDPGIAAVSSETLQRAIDPQVRPWRLGVTVFAMMGILALLVAGVGLYSVMSYFVAQRAHEIGVRVALGARPGAITRLVVGGSLALAGTGVAAGLVIALLTGRYLQPLLFDTSARDPLVLTAVTVVLLLTALAASAGPARRARRIDPLSALRNE